MLLLISDAVEITEDKPNKPDDPGIHVCPLESLRFNENTGKHNCLCGESVEDMEFSVTYSACEMRYEEEISDTENTGYVVTWNGLQPAFLCCKCGARYPVEIRCDMEEYAAIKIPIPEKI